MLKTPLETRIYLSGEEEVHAVSHISLEVKNGEFIVVTGPSGCSKPTLLHMMGGLNESSSGSIFVMGDGCTRFPVT